MLFLMPNQQCKTTEGNQDTKGSCLNNCLNKKETKTLVQICSQKNVNTAAYA